MNYQCLKNTQNSLRFSVVVLHNNNNNNNNNNIIKYGG